MRNAIAATAVWVAGRDFLGQILRQVHVIHVGADNLRCGSDGTGDKENFESTKKNLRKCKTTWVTRGGFCRVGKNHGKGVQALKDRESGWNWVFMSLEV